MIRLYIKHIYGWRVDACSFIPRSHSPESWTNLYEESIYIKHIYGWRVDACSFIPRSHSSKSWTNPHKESMYSTYLWMMCGCMQLHPPQSFVSFFPPVFRHSQNNLRNHNRPSPPQPGPSLLRHDPDHHDENLFCYYNEPGSTIRMKCGYFLENLASSNNLLNTTVVRGVALIWVHVVGISIVARR
jgi:hypothetical protein